MSPRLDFFKSLFHRRWFWILSAVSAVLIFTAVRILSPEAPPRSQTTPPATLAPASESEGAEALVKQLPVEDSRVVGQAFTLAVIDLMQNQLDRFLGWRPNDLLLNAVTDNVRNYQLGVLGVVRRVMLAFNDKLARFGSTYPMNPHLDKAFNDFNFSATKFWFPSTESVYRQAIDQLKLYLAGLSNPGGQGAKGAKSAFYPRSDNLIFLLGQLREVLGSCQNELTKTREENGQPVSFWKVDDYFYHSYGAMAAVLKIMTAVHIDFKEEIKAKSAQPLVEDIIATLARPVELLDRSEPLIIIDRPITSIFNNHRAQLNRPLADARQKMASLQTTLAK